MILIQAIKLWYTYHNLPPYSHKLANFLGLNPDNVSEFYDWKRFKRSIYNVKDDIDVYFCHSYASWEKGGV